jgi:hypothetical protein
MTPCLQPDEVVDLVDGVLTESRAAHVAACAVCRARTEAAAAALAGARAADVPEPSPFFWASLNRRVHDAIAGPPVAHGGWRGWLRWETVVPLAGMAALLVALGAAIARPPGQVSVAAPPVADAPALTAAEALVDPADDALALVVELAGTLPDAGSEALGLGPLPDLGDVAATALSDDELHALEEILRAAVDRPKS